MVVGGPSRFRSSTHTSHLSRNYGPGPRVSWSFPEAEGGCKKKCTRYCNLAASAPRLINESKSSRLRASPSSPPPAAVGVACCLRCLSRKGVVGLRDTHLHAHVYCKTEDLCLPACRNLTPTRIAGTCCIVSLVLLLKGGSPCHSTSPLVRPGPPSTMPSGLEGRSSAYGIRALRRASGPIGR